MLALPHFALMLCLQVVGYYGTKSVSYQEALAAIFIEGWIFIIISILGIRQRLIGLLPRYYALPRRLMAACLPGPATGSC